MLRSSATRSFVLQTIYQSARNRSYQLRSIQDSGCPNNSRIVQAAPTITRHKQLLVLIGAIQLGEVSRKCTERQPCVGCRYPMRVEVRHRNSNLVLDQITSHHLEVIRFEGHTQQIINSRTQKTDPSEHKTRTTRTSAPLRPYLRLDISRGRGVLRQSFKLIGQPPCTQELGK